MARIKDAEPILAAADVWKDRCLLGEQSLFEDRSLWTLDNFDLLLHNPFMSAAAKAAFEPVLPWRRALLSSPDSQGHSISF